MLPSRIHVPPPSNPDPEDIFASSLSTIFPDSNINSHGDPGGSLIYTSPTYGNIHLRVPGHPDKEEGRQLFAHYLWNAAGIVADEIEKAATRDGTVNDEKEQERRQWWDMRGERVLELGAGTALPSIIAAHAGAKEIYITDHPLSPALTTGSIHENVKRNLQVISTQNPSRDRASENGTPLSTEPNPPKTQITILPHTWGSSLSTPSSSLAHTFTKILIADCLWMPSQHANLVRTIKHFLRPVPAPTPTPTPPSPSPNPSNSPPTPLSGSPPCALLVAGFHTGRGVVAEFFRTATAPSPPPSTSSTTQPPASASAAAAEAEDSGQLTLASLHELDVSDGTEREFLLEERHGEGRGREEDRRWCVVGVLTLTGGCGGEEGEGTGTLKEEEKEGGKIAGKGLRRGRGGDGKQGLKGKGKEGGGGGRGGDGEEEEEEEVDMQDLALPAVALNVDEVGWV